MKESTPCRRVPLGTVVVAALLVAPLGAALAGVGDPIACHEAIDRGKCTSPDPVAFFPAAGAHTAVLATNFALVFPGSGAAAWEYVCDDAYGRPAPERIRRSPTGELYLPTTAGLLITRDGCTYERASGPIDGAVVFDVAIDTQNPLLVYALTGTPRTLMRSADGGRSFSAGYKFPDGLLLSRLVVPPTRTGELYVLGRGRGSSTPLAVSNDDGLTFAMRDVATGAAGPVRTSFELLAPHPLEPATIYFTIIESDGDELWRTSDGGVTTTRLLKLRDTEALGGLAFGATPAVLYVGGKNLYPERGAARGHLYVSRDAGATWLAPVPSGDSGPQFSCLSTSEGELYACGMGATSPEGLMVGASSDEGKTWRVVSRLADLTVPKACVVGQCQEVGQWLCDTYTTCAAGLSPADVLAPPPSDGGVADARVDVINVPPLPDDDGGCACRLGGRAPAGAWAVLLVGLGLVARRRRSSLRR